MFRERTPTVLQISFASIRVVFGSTFYLSRRLKNNSYSSTTFVNRFISLFQTATFCYSAAVRTSRLSGLLASAPLLLKPTFPMIPLLRQFCDRFCDRDCRKTEANLGGWRNGAILWDDDENQPSGFLTLGNLLARGNIQDGIPHELHEPIQQVPTR
jgi:hypothetical protein